MLCQRKHKEVVQEGKIIIPQELGNKITEAMLNKYSLTFFYIMSVLFYAYFLICY